MNVKYDMPKNYYFGGGGETFVTPLALIVLVAAMILMLVAPRRQLLAVLLGAGILLPGSIVVLVAQAHLPALRLLLACGWLRLALRGAGKPFRMAPLDIAVLIWGICNAVCFSLLWGTMGAVSNRVGFLWTNLGAYFLLRFLIRDKPDLLRVIHILAVLISIIGPAMLYEHFAQKNLFAVMGAPELSTVRGGAIRAEGPFSHPIIAGTIAGTLLPVFLGLLWRTGRRRLLLAGGTVGSLMMVVSSASSTSLMATAAGIFALLLWRFRVHLRALRWGFVGLLVCLQLTMRAPVWMLISRLGGSLGGSGYHRAMLIDNLVRHFSEWWLVGTRYNAAWGFDMWDVDNAFAVAAVGGGLVTMVAFISILVCAYRAIGRSRKIVLPEDRWFVWTLGACIFATTVGFFGIVYFDQSILIWYAVLAMVAALVDFPRRKRPPDSTSGTADLQTGKLAAAGVSIFDVARLKY